jgi:enoyl-CoA hydratase/carnithine racemase
MNAEATAPLVDYRKEGSLVTLTLNDPARRNGLSPALVEDLVSALRRLSADTGVGCAVLTANGSAFSAGGDPKRMLAPGLYPDMSTAEIRRFYAEGIQRVPLAFRNLDVPVIAAVNGAAIGAGCDLACLCDFRIASENASFAASFVKLGLVPGDGGAWLLPRIIGHANASQLLLSGDTVDAAEAQRLGLVSAVVPADRLLEEARQRAQRIAVHPPHATQLTKRLIAESQFLTLPAALELSATMQAMCHKMDDHREAVMAMLEKRPPKYSGR